MMMIALQAAYAASAALCVTDRIGVQPKPQPKPALTDWIFEARKGQKGGGGMGRRGGNEMRGDANGKVGNPPNIFESRCAFYRGDEGARSGSVGHKDGDVGPAGRVGCCDGGRLNERRSIIIDVVDSNGYRHGRSELVRRVVVPCHAHQMIDVLHTPSASEHSLQARGNHFSTGESRSKIKFYHVT